MFTSAAISTLGRLKSSFTAASSWADGHPGMLTISGGERVQRTVDFSESDLSLGDRRERNHSHEERFPRSPRTKSTQRLRLAATFESAVGGASPAMVSARWRAAQARRRRGRSHSLVLPKLAAGFHATSEVSPRSGRWGREPPGDRSRFPRFRTNVDRPATRRKGRPSRADWAEEQRRSIPGLTDRLNGSLDALIARRDRSCRSSRHYQTGRHCMPQKEASPFVASSSPSFGSSPEIQAMFPELNRPKSPCRVNRTQPTSSDCVGIFPRLPRTEVQTGALQRQYGMHDRCR